MLIFYQTVNYNEYIGVLHRHWNLYLSMKNLLTISSIMLCIKNK